MYYYEKLRNLEENKVDDFIRNRIEELEEEAKEYENDSNTIGYYLDYNPVKQLEDNNFYVDMCGIYKGYAPKGTRIVYGIVFINDKEFLVGNDGNYYYLDTDDYIYEFCKWVKDIEMNDEYELFYCIQKFIHKYFGAFSSVSREKMFELFYKDDNTYFDPINEHGFSWFKGRGNAMCTEYAVVAQNILSFFGIESYLLYGEEKEDDCSESHAFNFISCKDEETGKDGLCLIDFAMPVPIYNINLELKGEYPFMCYMEDFGEDDLIEYYENERVFCYPEHIYMLFYDDMVKLDLSMEREYSLKQDITPNIMENKNKQKGKYVL